MIIEIRTYFWTEWKENTAYQNVCYAASSTLRMKRAALNALIK